MAISPPSDLVMDVLRAADPTQVQAAQEKLKANRAAFRATSLADAGKGFASMLGAANSAEFDAGVSRANTQKINPADVPKAYRDYEAVFLQNFVKSMMPEDTEDVFGKGLAGDMWKSMSAEHIGQAIADSGGVGIAEQMYAQQLQHMQRHTQQSAANEDERQTALSLVRDLERRTFGVSQIDESDKSSKV